MNFVSDIIAPPVPAPARRDRRTLRLLLDGRVKEAVHLATPWDDCDPGTKGRLAQRAADGQSLLDELGLGRLRQQSQTGDSTSIIVLRCPGARRATIVFSGNGRLFTMPKPLLAASDMHAILIRDPSRCFGLAGIPGLGDDYDECLDNMCRLRRTLQAERLFCMGVSAGGAAALKFGCDMRAAGILGFSAPTTLNLDDDPGAELKHYSQLTPLYRRARHRGIDFAAYYKSCLPRPRVMLVYSAGHTRDSWLAERMRDIPGVELVDTPGYSGHTTHRFVTEQGEVGPLLKRLFAMDPWHAPVECVS